MSTVHQLRLVRRAIVSANNHEAIAQDCDKGADEIELLRSLLSEAKQGCRRLIEPGPNSFWWDLEARINAALCAADREDVTL